LLCCFNDHPEKIGALAASAAAWFDVVLEKNLSLLTIRHYDDISLKKLIEDKTVLLEQRTVETVQVLMR
jgi:aspartate kinase